MAIEITVKCEICGGWMIVEARVKDEEKLEVELLARCPGCKETLEAQDAYGRIRNKEIEELTQRLAESTSFFTRTSTIIHAGGKTRTIIVCGEKSPKITTTNRR